MKLAKNLFLLFIFVVSFFRPRQEVNAQSLPMANDLSANPSAQDSGLSTTVVVYMMHLDNNGVSTGDFCRQGDGEDTGCVEHGSGLIYPPSDPYITFAKPDTANPLRVDIEQYYLKNVLPREMDVVTNDPPLAALKAQVLAARSIADWKADKYYNQFDEFKSIDNSTGYQVFVPGSYEAYYDHNDLDKANRLKGLIEQAISETSGQYLFYPNDQGILSLDAEFSNDIGSPTTYGNQDYLIPVQDPISIACDLNPVGNGWGMSQKGAIRWSKGNQCAGNGDQPWPVRWDDYKQILVHYYTGIDILDGSGNKVAPDDRWNLLFYDSPTPEANSYRFDLRLQNTSTTDWAAGEIILGYQWTPRGASPNPGNWNQLGLLPEVSRGNPSLDLTVSISNPPSGGEYTLHLDLLRNGHWFSEQNLPWPDATIDINVTGPTATPTLTFSPPTFTSAPTLISGVLSCNTVVAGVTCTNYGTYLDYSININVTGLTGGATASAITIGTFKRNTTGGNMGMMSDFVHSETSVYSANTVLSLVRIHTSSGDVNYPSFTSGTGTNVQVTNNVNDWRNIGGAANFANTLQVRGNVNWPITGYSVVGHIYLYSNEGFVPGSASTITPIPTGTPKPCNCTIDFLQGLCNLAFSSSKLAAPVQMLQSTQQALLDLQLFHRVEDEVLSQTLQGQHYIQLYYGHGPEIIDLLRNNPTLKEEAISTLQLWEPNLQALVDSEGSNVSITNGQVQAAQTFLDHLYSLGSAELRQTIDSERALKPLESTVGMTMNQASTYLVNFQIEPTAAPATNTATATLTPSITYTSTNTPTNTVTFTPVVTETPTFTPSPTVTVSPSDTTTPLPEDTFTPSPTPSPTVTEAIVNTSTPTDVATLTPTETILPTETPAYTASLLYLHGTGPAANPPTLFLDSLVPVGTTVKYKDSTSVNFNNGNVWKEIGTWITSPSSSQLISLNELHTWLGLKNSDDQGARFDVRAEIYKNDELVTSGETYCITNITRNANQAKEVIVLFDEFDPVSLDNSMDELSIKILTRIGTDGAGAFCGGHSNAVGLRLYFDASNRPAGFDGVFIP